MCFTQVAGRLLGLDKSLTWKICRLVRDENPAAAISLIPGQAGLKILTTALAKAGAPADLMTALRNATDEFNRMVNVHSGDRETLEMMLGNISDEGQQARAEAHRKLSFRGNSATWGVQARVQICTNLIAPGTDETMVDLAWLSGLIDFRRLRRDAAWAMAAARKTDDDGAPLPLGHISAIDPNYTSPDVAPLMGDFCSKPLPEIRILQGRDGVTRYELVEGPVGNTAAATCIIGLYGRNFVRRTRTEHDTLGEHFARLYTPVETLIHDLFVHRDLHHAMTPKIALYSQMPGGPVFPISGRERGQLAAFEPPIELGGRPPALVTPELPAYPRMLRAVFERMGWSPNDFYGFRFRMRFPPIPTLALWRYELPAPAGKTS